MKKFMILCAYSNLRIVKNSYYTIVLNPIIIQNKLQVIDCYTSNSGARSCIVLFTCPCP